MGRWSSSAAFLLDEDFRKEMLATVGDPHVASFWESEFPMIVGRRPQAPILTRLDTFLRSKLVRRVVTVEKPRLDFQTVVDDGHIFLGNLSMGTIGEESAALLGSLVVSKLHQVALARVGQAVEERQPFFLYVDEFHHVATASMASLFSGVRKYRLGLTVAHHDLHQLRRSSPEVERSLMANAYTRICFRVGDDDARLLAQGFGNFDSADLMELGLGEALCRVGGRTADFNLRTQRLPRLDRDAARRRREEVRERSARRWGEPAEKSSEAPAPTQQGVEEEVAAPSPSRDEGSDSPESVPPRSRGSEHHPAPLAVPLGPDLGKAGLDYLEHVAKEPFLSMRDRHRALSLSAWKGNRIKKELLADDLVREVPISPGGRGRGFKLSS